MRCCETKCSSGSCSLIINKEHQTAVGGSLWIVPTLRRYSLSDVIIRVKLQGGEEERRGNKERKEMMWMEM